VKSVLVVDDDEDLAALLDMGLSRHGYAITIARNCSEAHEVASQEVFDAVITDLSLPDGTGSEMVKSLEPRPRAVVIVSGFEPDSAIGADARSCADVFMLKPVDVDTLAQRLGQLLSPAD
jgi:DNA-binding response OmpR family regulator